MTEVLLIAQVLVPASLLITIAALLQMRRSAAASPVLVPIPVRNSSVRNSSVRNSSVRNRRFH